MALYRLPLVLRSFGIALGIFLFLNLALALERPELSTTGVWLQLKLAEPFRSFLAAGLGAALFVPHAMARSPRVRWILGLTFAAFLGFTIDCTAAFYEAILAQRIRSDVPVPLSALLSCILLGELVRVVAWRPADPISPPPAWAFLQGLSVAGAFVMVTVAHIVTYGHVDHRRPADAAVVLGAKVYSDGKPCAALIDRLDTAVELFRSGLVGHLIMSGAEDPNGWSEPAVMRDYAIERGVPSSRIILDELGVNTRASALGVGEIQRSRGFQRLLAVTQYFHCARVKLIFDRVGTSCFTVPTCSAAAGAAESTVKLSRELFFVLREAVALPYYLVYYR